MGKGINEPPVVTHRAASDDPPPSYTDATLPVPRSRSSASPAATTGAAPAPLGTQRALAPLSVIKKDSAVRKPYVVALDTLAARQNAGPDVRLETADAPIDTTVFVTGRLARAARIEAGTSDAPLRLRVQRDAGQAVDVRATTTNARAHVWLPNGFDGLVTAKTKGSRVALSPAVRARAVQLPTPGGDPDPLKQTWAVRVGAPDAPGAPGGEGPEPGPDRLFVQTKNMRVCVYAGTEDEGGGERCVAQ